MPQRFSRRKLAEYVATRLIAGDTPKKALREVAAYLVEAKRTRELELVVRDIESALAAHGVVIADVTSARPLSDKLRQEIGTLVDAKDVKLRETIDESVLGGVRVVTPDKRFDGTIRRKLAVLKSKAI